MNRVAVSGMLCCAAMIGLAGALTASARAEAGADPTQRILHDGFERGYFAPEGGLFYTDNPEQRSGRVVFDGVAPDSGAGAVTVVVAPSCLSHAVGCSERTEIWERPEVLVPFHSTVWYGFALHLNDALAQDDRRYVIAQWKREILPEAVGDYSPFLALRLGITVETDLFPSYPIGGSERPEGCLPGEALVINSTEAQQTRALIAIESGTTTKNFPSYFNACAPGIRVASHADLPSAQQGWIDFVIRSQPGPDGEGHIEVIAGGVHTVTLQGHIGHGSPGLDDNQYFKMGPYRAPPPPALEHQLRRFPARTPLQRCHPHRAMPTGSVESDWQAVAFDV